MRFLQSIIKDSIDSVFSETVTLDGCFLAGRKEVFTEIMWNENIKGFHLYDIDISQRISSRYIIGVYSNILITHLSNGNFDYKWLNETFNYHAENKIANNSTIPLSFEIPFKLDLYGFKLITNIIIETNSFYHYFKLWNFLFKKHPYYLRTYLCPPYYLVKNILKKYFYKCFHLLTIVS